jgi:rSAM/selenodomain-associated transferase 2/rSAM/selenodomain-associated transferase 1
MVDNNQITQYQTTQRQTTQRLIVFTRYPEPGKTKTRLIPALGPYGAAHVQRQMTEHALGQVRRFQQFPPQSLVPPLPESPMPFPSQSPAITDIEVRFAGGNQTLIQNWLGQDLFYQYQGEGELGVRLARAFAAAFTEGMERVVAIGIDCPQLGPAEFAQAFAALEHHDLVLGPAADGGYYLIGLRWFVPSLFEQIDWGSDRVLQQTLAAAQSAQLSVGQLGTLTDVDRPDDLSVWLQVKRGRQQSLSVSIVIPTLNEAQTIGPTLTSLQDTGVEVIVVDGCSQDRTKEVAQQYGALVLSCSPGRAYQMNEGASHATGDVLLFLHADTQLPPDFLTHVRNTLGQPGVVLGAFRLGFGKRGGWGLSCMAWGNNLRSRWLQLPYGDQAFFLKRSVFYNVGGFADLPIMEDFELAKRLQKRGFVRIAPVAIITSPRRWQKLGICRTFLTNRLMTFGYALGISPKRLVQWYYGSRSV